MYCDRFDLCPKIGAKLLKTIKSTYNLNVKTLKIHFLLILTLISSLCIGQGGGPGGGGILPRLADFVFSKKDLLANIEATNSEVYWSDFWQNGGVKLPLVEYEENVSSVDQVAYKRGSNIDVELTLKNHQSAPVTFTFIARRARVVCPGQVQYMGSFFNQPTETINLQVQNAGVLQTGTIPPGGIMLVTFKIRNVPNYVSVGSLDIGYDLPCNLQNEQLCDNGTNGSFEHLVRLYLLLDNPIDLVALPWLDFAEYSCRWAYGATDKASTVVK